MFFITHNHTENFEEEEEEDELGIDDALLGELDDALVDEDDLLGEELTPIIKNGPFEIGGEEDTLKEDDAKLFGEDDDEEEDADYDSFDDRDEF